MKTEKSISTQPSSKGNRKNKVGSAIGKDADVLHTFIAESFDAATGWMPDDLGAMLEHQLAIPLNVSLEQNVDDTLNGMSDVPETAGALLNHPKPPLTLLRRMKDLSNGELDNPDRLLPEDLLFVLYYAAISTALIRRDTRISSMSDESLIKGLQWCLRRTWLNDSVRTILSTCLDVLK